MQRFVNHLVIFSVLFSTILNATAERPIRVLSIDGGGVRGIIPAAILENIEKEIGRPISQIFDFIAGTSTGGIIALAFSAPDENNKPTMTAEEVVNTYIEKSSEIFRSSWRHWIYSMGGLTGPKYEATGLRKVIEEQVGATMLSQALIPTLVTGYHVDGQTGIEFYSEDAKAFPMEKDCMMLDVGLATAAAPVFFDSVDVTFPWGTLQAVADGALYQHNPALLAYINAKKLYPNRTIELYSLGTGRVSAEDLKSELKGRGVVQWMRPIIRHIQIGDSEAVHSILHKMLNENGEENYFRFNVNIDREHMAMDSTSEETLQYLYTQAETLTETKTFKAVLERLKR